MLQPRVILTAVLAQFALVLSAAAGTIAADALPLPNRVAVAETVVVGKVTAIEDKAVQAVTTPGGKDKVDYKIAVITVGDALVAPKDTKTIRLGFVPPPPNVVISPAPLLPTVGMEGCFFLTKHFDAEFYTAPGPLDFVDKKNGTFEKDVALIKRCVKLLEDPDASLKSKKAEDRFLTAGMLVARYRSRKTQNADTEQIDAEQSKLILNSLLEADWTPSNDFTQLTPLMVLGKLPLTEKDGWSPPKDPKEYPAYAQKWLKEHADTYRIGKFVEKK